MLTRIYHKKNELFQVEFYQNEECQQVFNFENIKNLYIELKDGDCTPIFSLSNKLWSLNIKANIFTPAWYLGLYDGISPQTPLITLNDVLDDIDLSKYIPKDNAVLFLSEGEANKHSNNCEAWFLYQKDFPARQFNSEMDIRDWKAITIFLTHGTESELKKANEIVQELKEKYGVYEVNVFVLHCFVNLRPTWLSQISFLNGVLTFHFFNILTHSKQEIILAREECGEELENNYYCAGINTITTTNSTKIAHNEGYHCELEHKFNILDCYDIFNDYLEGE